MSAASSHDLTYAPETARRAEALYQERYDQVTRRIDRLFERLFIAQWMGAIVGAIIISPRAWDGPTSKTHLHVWAAILLGGLITSFPIALARRYPGRPVARHVIAAAQMMFSALLIHVTGGRIETHFHVFGSLTFIAFYRDWRVLIPATLVVLVDHLVRGIFWPQSVYGVLAASPWRSVEHAAWVVFENIFLIRACIRSQREMRHLAGQQAQLEVTNQNIEAQVKARTAELRAAQHKLLDASRMAGMAEIATGVLHNVGNVLNSVNVSANLIHDTVRHSRVDGLAKAAGLLKQQEDAGQLATFVSQDPRGRKIPEYLESLAEVLAAEQQMIQKELAGLTKGVEHIKTIVATQQSYAKVSGVTEEVRVQEVIEDALAMSMAAFERHHIGVTRQFEDVPPMMLDRPKLLQILVNLIRNAKHAMCDHQVSEKHLILRIGRAGPDRVRIELQDTGVGIARENLSRIFEHGFTTKKDGKGFGLHSCALAAREMGGAIRASSEGHGRGATFTLELPLQLQEARA